MSIADLMVLHEKIPSNFCLFLYAKFTNYFCAPLFFGIESFLEVYFFGEGILLRRFEADSKTFFAFLILQCMHKL